MNGKRRFDGRLLLLAVVAWCTFLLGASCEDKTIYEHTWQISGTVTDTLTGQPLDSARITWGDTVSDVHVLTNTDGTYEFGVPMNRPTLFARKEGYLTKSVELRLTREYTSGMDFELTPN